MIRPCPSCGGDRFRTTVKRAVYTCRTCGHHRGPDNAKLTDQHVAVYRTTAKVIDRTVREVRHG